MSGPDEVLAFGGRARYSVAEANLTCGRVHSGDNAWVIATRRLAGWAELSWAIANRYAAEGWTMSADDHGALSLSGLSSASVPAAAQTLTVTGYTK